MEVAMSLNALVRLPLSNSKLLEDGVVRHSLFSARTMHKPHHTYRRPLLVEAKGKKGMQSRLSQRPGPPPLPKIEDDGNPKFVIFIRMANVCSISFLLHLCFYLFTLLSFSSIIFFLFMWVVAEKLSVGSILLLELLCEVKWKQCLFD